MGTVLLQVPLTSLQLDQLHKEFPHYRFLLLNQEEIDKLSPGVWKDVEVFWGGGLSCDQLSCANELRWISLSHRHLDRIPLEEIRKRENIIVTLAQEEGAAHIAEFVMGVVLGFAKTLPHWLRKQASYTHLCQEWQDRWRDAVWTLAQRSFLQVGLGKTGSLIAKQAHQMGCIVKGVMGHGGFHPDCVQIFDYSHLSIAIAEAEIISVTLPIEEYQVELLGKKELEAIKEGAILVVVGSHRLIDLHALAEVAAIKKLRGIWLDLPFMEEIAPDSPLWRISGVIISPDVAALPRVEEKALFQSFHFSLRQYAAGNFSDMMNLFRVQMGFYPMDARKIGLSRPR